MCDKLSQEVKVQVSGTVSDLHAADTMMKAGNNSQHLAQLQLQKKVTTQMKTLKLL